MNTAYQQLLTELPDKGYCELEHNAIIRVSGPDRISYLQGQLTCDLHPLQPGMQTLSGYCDPKGRLWATLRVLVLNDELLLLTNQQTAPALLEALKKFAVFSNVEFSDASDHWRQIGCVGNISELTIATHSELYLGGIRVQYNHPLPRELIVIPRQASWAELVEQREPFPASLWQGLDIASGIAHLQTRHQQLFLPQSINLQLLGGVSFRKGCYTGQEMVARAKYRGANNRRLYLLGGHTDTETLEHPVLERKLDSGWRKGGEVINLWQHQNQIMLQAVLPLDLEPDSQFRIQGDEHSQLTILPLPYSLQEPE